jgi:hypothetical protein
VVGCTIGSIGEVPGERKPVIRGDIIIIIIIACRLLAIIITIKISVPKLGNILSEGG